MKQLIQIKGNRIVRRIPLEKAEYRLGRGLENDIIFNTAKVSRLHAVLVEDGDTYCIIDKGATNHVFVNGEQVTERRLAPGDQISLAREVNLLYLGESEAGQQAPDVLNYFWEAINKRDFLRLKEVTNRIISLDQLDQILNVILAEVMRLVNAERGFIALTDERGQIQAGASVSANIPLQEDGARNAVFSHSVVRRAIEQREAVFILNANDRDVRLSDSILKLDLRSIMCSPLLFGDKLVGVLYVDSRYYLADFSEIDQFFFSILSDYAAIAIENAKLFDQVQRSNQILREEVQESEERYRQLVEYSPDAIAVHSEGKLVFVNAAAVKLLGAGKAEDLLGKPVIDVVHPEYRDLVLERIRQEIEEGQPAPLMEEKLVRLDGSAVDVEVRGVPMTYRGKAAVQIIARDVTERKRMKQALIRAQKLESVGVLAGGIAHDFNNILQVIKGNARLARARIDEKENVELCLAAIDKAVNRAISLTTQLLTFSKGGAPITQAASIEVLIEETVGFALRGSNVAYHIEFEEGLRLVEMDSDQIGHVIHNLVINAKQAMPAGGTITISASNHDVTEAEAGQPLPAGRFVKISVRDEGVGMSDSVLEKIFDPYFTTKQDGSGLGLASCYSIITRHGGVIEAESKEGEGATFTFYLPVSTKPLERKEADASVEPLSGRVLLMDDDEMVRETACRMLQEIGCRVETVANGAAAIDRYLSAREAGQPFDLVIFDLTVPGGMGGKEAMEKLRAFDPAVKAIVISGYSNDPVMANPQQYGFQAVVSKPFDLAEMTRAVQTLLLA